MGLASVESEQITTVGSWLEGQTARARIEWAVEQWGTELVMSTSFGIQSAVMLHLATRVAPQIPVIWVDTGYHFAETYRFAETLRERLELNLKVVTPNWTAARQEAVHGKRWEQGLKGLEAYNRDNKVEPMERALNELGAGTWFAGLRRVQSGSRARTPFVQRSGERYKVHPIADWSDRDVHDYLRRHDLPYHPLWERGYVSIGDVHSTRSLAEVDSIEETRFRGLKRECGLHEMRFGNTVLRTGSD